MEKIQKVKTYYFDTIMDAVSFIEQQLQAHVPVSSIMIEDDRSGSGRIVVETTREV